MNETHGAPMGSGAASRCDAAQPPSADREDGTGNGPIPGETPPPAEEPPAGGTLPSGMAPLAGGAPPSSEAISPPPHASDARPTRNASARTLIPSLWPTAAGAVGPHASAGGLPRRDARHAASHVRRRGSGPASLRRLALGDAGMSDHDVPLLLAAVSSTPSWLRHKCRNGRRRCSSGPWPLRRTTHFRGCRKGRRSANNIRVATFHSGSRTRHCRTCTRVSRCS